MQCQLCNENAATIHLTEITNGQRLETHLCQECAQKQGLAVKNQIPLTELLSTLLSAQPEVEPEALDPDGPDSQISCPHCGMTIEKFRKSSLLGCPNDYDVFDKTLQLIIEKAHNGNKKHQGKVPSRAPSDTKTQVELMRLRDELEVAVKAEDYETAAKLRDKIGHLQ